MGESHTYIWEPGLGLVMNAGNRILNLSSTYINAFHSVRLNERLILSSFHDLAGKRAQEYGDDKFSMPISSDLKMQKGNSSKMHRSSL